MIAYKSFGEDTLVDVTICEDFVIKLSGKTV